MVLCEDGHDRLFGHYYGDSSACINGSTRLCARLFTLAIVGRVERCSWSVSVDDSYGGHGDMNRGSRCS